jgi:hypothetical protein
MKYTKSEFAQEIRRLYPNDYNDLSDKDLVSLWLNKFPNDKGKIKSSTGCGFEIAVTIVVIICAIFIPFLWILVIGIVIYLIPKVLNSWTSNDNISPIRPKDQDRAGIR